MDELQPDKDVKKSDKIIAIVLVIICLIAAVFLVMTYILPISNEKQYTSIYTNATADAAYDLINNTSGLLVIDCRGLEGCSTCQFNQGHLPNATLNMNAQSLYNETNDILVYSKNGTVGVEFCEELVGHVYGNIYNLEGGYEAWKDARYPPGKPYTTTYMNVSAEIAYDIINTTTGLLVEDCRGLDPNGCSRCEFGHGHLPGATLNMNALTLYNESNDILVYSGDGTMGAVFCQELVGHVYGKIYNLDGGYSAWTGAGFPVYQI